MIQGRVTVSGPRIQAVQEVRRSGEVRRAPWIDDEPFPAAAATCVILSDVLNTCYLFFFSGSLLP